MKLFRSFKGEFFLLASVGIMAHYWNGGYTIGMVAILLKKWLTIENVAHY